MQNLAWWKITAFGIVSFCCEFLSRWGFVRVELCRSGVLSLVIFFVWTFVGVGFCAGSIHGVLSLKLWLLSEKSRWNSIATSAVSKLLLYCFCSYSGVRVRPSGHFPSSTGLADVKTLFDRNVRPWPFLLFSITVFCCLAIPFYGCPIKTLLHELQCVL